MKKEGGPSGGKKGSHNRISGKEPPGPKRGGEKDEFQRGKKKKVSPARGRRAP